MQRCIIGVLVALFVMACGLPQFTSPEVALRDMLTQNVPPQEALSFQTHGIRRHEAEVIVLFSKLTREGRTELPDWQPQVGYHVMQQGMNGDWMLRRGVAFLSDQLLPQDQLLEYHVDATSSGTIVFGQTLSSKITQVEAKLDTGVVIRDTVTDGMFWFQDADARAVCELRALDAQDRVLRRFDPAVSAVDPPYVPQDARQCEIED
jgi:hypothetical protein